ncbi:MAG: DNA primase [Candidatus Altiarchaeota archaeon]|nr:DNA primase [Candidatus Altiarchaeota archaeon]
MAKAPADITKYNIYADIMIDGVVEKPDVVGAIFGQSEGLLGEGLELRDLQKTGRIGRIEVDIKTKVGKSSGTVVVPSSLDMVETSIIAAAIETVDRVGPCNAKITVKDVEDARSQKRKAVVNRAKDILKKLMDEEIPESMELTDEVKKSVQLSEIASYENLPAGPAIATADSIILVEGRADVLNMLKCGIKNVIAVGGTNIPKQIIDLSKEKTSIAFLDGDRGGDIILKELSQVADIDFVARTPRGKEVEELTKKEVVMALRRKVPLSQLKGFASKEESGGNDQVSQPSPGPQRPPQQQTQQPNNNGKLLSLLKEVKGKLTARLFDKNLEQITEIEIKDLVPSLKDVQPYCVVFDGIVTQRLVDAASESGVGCIVGINKSDVSNIRSIRIFTER